MHSQTRFNIAHAGRRAGKTEIAKRRQVLRAIGFDKPQGRFVFGAPTHRQAVDIFWDDVVAMVPRSLLFNGLKSISLSYRRIKLWNGAFVEVLGLDKPERIEGPPLDGFVGDEFGNFKPTVWQANIRPALGTLGRPGYADLIGVPEGRNHYYQLAQDAKDNPDWSIFAWHTSEINPDEAESLRTDLDELTYSQEAGGEFVSFKGRCYYAFDEQYNCPPNGERVLYDSRYPFDLAFDFNRTPGNCTISQEQQPPAWLIKQNGGRHNGPVTAVIGEVFLTSASNTEILCDKVLDRWRPVHKGLVRLFGDATGGIKKTQSLAGSDWDIIQSKLDTYNGGPWLIEECYGKSNPPVRVRINTVNSRLHATDGYVGTIIDKSCKYLIRDFEGVTCEENGDIKKEAGSMLTHISDACGYLLCVEHPINDGTVWSNTAV